MRTVLIADNNTRLSQLLALLLADEDEFDVLGVCTTASCALERARHERPDVVLVSESLAGQPGAALCQALRPAAPDAAVLLWSHDPVRQSYDTSTADALLGRGMTFRGLVRGPRGAPPLPRPAPADEVALDEAARPTPDVYRSAAAPVPARRPLRSEIDDPEDAGRMVLACESCGVRLPVPTADMPAAIAQARGFFRSHDRCDTSIDLTRRSPHSASRR